MSLKQKWNELICKMFGHKFKIQSININLYIDKMEINSNDAKKALNITINHNLNKVKPIKYCERCGKEIE